MKKIEMSPAQCRFDKAMDDFLAGNWQSRSLSDTTVYPLVREEVTGSD
jgi:hypothetical protein